MPHRIVDVVGVVLDVLERHIHDALDEGPNLFGTPDRQTLQGLAGVARPVPRQRALSGDAGGWARWRTVEAHLEAILAQQVVVTANVVQGQRDERGEVLADPLAAVAPEDRQRVRCPWGRACKE